MSFVASQGLQGRLNDFLNAAGVPGYAGPGFAGLASLGRLRRLAFGHPSNP
jgi:hypothetical protein